jgi:hypothetical protein
MKTIQLLVFTGLLLRPAFSADRIEALALRQYDLKITDIQPPNPLEHEEIVVSYQLIVTIKGNSAFLRPQKLPGRICSSTRLGTCPTIADLRAGTWEGSLRTSAPAAGADVPVIIELLTRVPGDEVAEFPSENVQTSAERRIPVSARYEVSIDAFTIHRTRARHEDTVKISLRGFVNGQRSAANDACLIVGPPIYCVTNVAQGDHNDGTHTATGVRVGPFDLVPEVTDDLAFAYVVLNLGTPYELRVFNKIMNGVSDATAAFLKVLYPQAGGAGGGWDSANDFTKKLNDMQFGGCDGPVAADGHVILNKTISGASGSTLDARTRSTGRFTETSGTYEIESQDGCGKSPRYDVTWSIIRTSWRAP